jgi:hypothetical protein
MAANFSEVGGLLRLARRPSAQVMHRLITPSFAHFDQHVLGGQKFLPYAGSANDWH